MDVEAIVDSIQKYEAHTLQKTRLKHVHERSILYESDDEYSSGSSPDKYVQN